ncbi:MAG: hypothetical protein ACYC6A_14555 [Armatimonadota bacterium]
MTGHRAVLFLWVVLCLASISCLAEEAPAIEADAPAPPATDAAAPEPLDDNRALISRPPYALRADEISYNAESQEFVADGNAEISAPQGQFTAGNIHYNFLKNTGYLECARGAVAPFFFCADTLTLDAKNTKHMQGSQLTTCSREHPHYALHARDVVVKPDNHYEARHVALSFGGRRLFTIPRLAGDLSKEETEDSRPPLLVGLSKLDGVYLATLYDYPLSENTGVLLSGRFGTKQVLRGDLSLYKNVTLSPTVTGAVSLRVTGREDAPNRVTGQEGEEDETFQSLTVSRLPAVQALLDPVPLKGDLQGFSVRAGASAGRYHETPTDVTANRAQLWATLRTPAYRLGPAEIRAEFGAQHAFYPEDKHQVGIAQFVIESPQDADKYFSLRYIYRKENGQTPFRFDRVVVPQELYSEVEFPIPGSNTWRLGLSNRLDLEQKTSRGLGIMAIYRLDCISYALSYNTVGQTFGVGFVLNAFGNFHTRAGAVRFTE